MKKTDLYNYFKTQFNDLKGAKIFYKKWKENDQVIENHPEWEFTLRAMAAHISMFLENKTIDENKLFTNYLETKYGSDIYWS